METDLLILSKRLFEDPALLTTDLPATLIRIQIKLKDQQVKVKSKASQLVDLVEARNERSRPVRQYRDVLAELEDWLDQTRNSVSAELKFVSSQVVALDVHILAVSLAVYQLPTFS